MRIQRSHTCTRKIRYDTKRRALREKKNMKRGGKFVKYLHVYRCPFCREFHLGHKAMSKKRRRAKENKREMLLAQAEKLEKMNKEMEGIEQ